MNAKNNGVPGLLIFDERSRPTTAELCGDQAEGLRCTLTKGHVGPHECLATRRGAMQWESSDA